MLKLKPYVEALAGSKEQEAADLAEVRANQTKKELELEASKLETEILKAETDIASLTRRFPLDHASLLQHLDALALKERKLKQLNEIIATMFPK